MGVYDKEFGETVVWPVRPVWELESVGVDMELLTIKHSNKNADLVSEYYNYRDC
uniref:Uncharacterized protein n=1 Tax=Anguilla anguilla TaxID=7936 RepID=A0A0E9U4E4_ANGAN